MSKYNEVLEWITGKKIWLEQIENFGNVREFTHGSESRVLRKVCLNNNPLNISIDAFQLPME